MTKETKNPWAEMDKGREKKSYAFLAERLDGYLKAP
jgi:hypothetical protein